MIGDSKCSYKDALDQTYPSKDINNQLEWGSMVYNKCRHMMQTEVSQNTDCMIQKLNNEISKVYEKNEILKVYEKKEISKVYEKKEISKVYEKKVINNMKISLEK